MIHLFNYTLTTILVFIPNTNPLPAYVGKVKQNTHTTGGIKVDLAGLPSPAFRRCRLPADSNPRPFQCNGYIGWGKGEKSRLLRLFCSKITIQLAALLARCYSISVPKLIPNCSRSMKQGKVIPSHVQRR